MNIPHSGGRTPLPDFVIDHHKIVFLIDANETVVVEVEILHIEVEGSHGPGDLLVMPDDDGGGTGKRAADDVEIFGLEVIDVKGAGPTLLQVRVAGEDWLAGFAARSGEDPGV